MISKQNEIESSSNEIENGNVSSESISSIKESRVITSNNLKEKEDTLKN